MPALTNAERQKRFADKRERELAGYRAQVRKLLDALSTACEQSRCAWVTNRLPEEPWDACEVLAIRLDGARVIPAPTARQAHCEQQSAGQADRKVAT